MNIARKIRSFRLSRRMTIKEVAARIGVPPSTYRDWEYGRKINAEKLQTLADAFEISMDELTGRDDAHRSGLRKAILLLEEALGILRRI